MEEVGPGRGDFLDIDILSALIPDNSPIEFHA